MLKSIISVILSLASFFAPTAQQVVHTAPTNPQWEYIGEQRITCYCPTCNDGEGYESSSGKTLEYGDCACRWLPIGAEISVEGETFTVVDTCGTDAIDIFIDTDTCECNLNEYRKVSVKR